MAVEVWSPFSFSVIKLNALTEMKINKRSICESQLKCNVFPLVNDGLWSVSDTGMFAVCKMFVTQTEFYGLSSHESPVAQPV